ncbi:MAG: DUF371 domain-containing protein [Archaeoglobi archaeon]|nr:DUF371 domain-containing protein [Archaeoglobi archaeon]
MRSGRSTEEIIAYGHENITARHRTTLEVTKDKEVTPRGDCIIGVRASKSVRDLNDEVKEGILAGKEMTIELELPDYGMKTSFQAFGSEKLTLSHESDVVVRKSTYTCSRTLAIRSELSASDLDREFVELLRDRKTVLIMRILV